VKEIFFPKRMWRRRPELKRRYDVVIVGGGSHGLATAYYLAKHHGVRDVCILEKSYIGAGASGRNTTIIRANYRTPEGAAFYRESVKLYEKLSTELDFNLMFSQHGHLTLAHSDRAMNTMRERAEVNRLLGSDSSVIAPDRIRELCPELDLSDHPPYPILGALYHPPGGIIRHDAVVWGFARQADRRGVEIHQGTEVSAARS
jgi:sarcosine oxidase subunit beta